MYKVLHIAYSTDSGGICSVILNYYAHIDRNMIHFDLAQCEDYRGTAIDKYEQESFKIYFIGNKTGLSLFSHIINLYKILKKEKYDAIHVHTAHTSWVDLMVGLICGVKKRIVHAHNAERNINTIKQKIRIVTGRLLLEVFATDKIACGEDAAVFMYGKRALSNKKTVLLPNAIDLNRFRFDKAKRDLIRKQFDITDDCLLFGTVGRLSYEKNQIFLINLLSAVKKIQDNVRLLIVGEGTDRSILEQFAAEKQLQDSVFFTGNRTDVDAIMCALDVFVLPSLYEGFPVTAIEAKASGLPVILSDTITKELLKYGDFNYLSLYDDLSIWALEVIKIRLNILERERGGLNNSDRLDIQKTGLILQGIYLS